MFLDASFVKKVIEDPLSLNRHTQLASSLDAMQDEFDNANPSAVTLTSFNRSLSQTRSFNDLYDLTFWVNLNKDGDIMCSLKPSNTASKLYPFHLDLPLLEKFIKELDRSLSEHLAAPSSSRIIKAVSAQREVRLLTSTRDFSSKLELRVFEREDTSKPFERTNFGFIVNGFAELSSFRRCLPALRTAIAERKNYEVLKTRIAQDLLGRFFLYCESCEIPEVLFNRGKS